MTADPGSLVAISRATAMLAEARTLEDVRGIRDLAEAARVYARAHDLGSEAAMREGRVWHVLCAPAKKPTAGVL